jgi:hypothetical protein
VVVGESAIRVPLVYLLPVDMMVELSTAMLVAVFVGLSIWTARWVAHAESAGS